MYIFQLNVMQFNEIHSKSGTTAEEVRCNLCTSDFHKKKGLFVY